MSIIIPAKTRAILIAGTGSGVGKTTVAVGYSAIAGIILYTDKKLHKSTTSDSKIRGINANAQGFCISVGLLVFVF